MSSAGPSLSCDNGSDAASAAAPVTRYLARQPILDLKGRVVAYELLYRDAAVEAFKGPGDSASRAMIDNTILYGLSKLTAGLPAFINCTADTLLGEFIQIMPPLLTVLEILESVEVTEEIVKACDGLRRKGYRIALDDFEYRRSLNPLIRIASFLKVDFLATSTSTRSKLISALPEFKGTFLAEKIETFAEYEKARQEGFTLVQGYYFCKPILIRKGAVPANRHVHLRLLRLMQEDPLNIREIGEIVKSEPSLAYRLLRFVNSAVCAISQEVTSITTALLVVGDDLFRRMATLAIAVELNVGPSPEILRMALVRARFCEVSAPHCKLNSTEQYLLGLFSLLDGMLQMPMEEALAPLSLAAPIRDALLGTDARRGGPLQWLERHEHGDFSRCDELVVAYELEPGVMEQNYLEATLWADELLAESG
ncbi:MAG: HDOD domain-containing protein [Terracidiphilus sp.]